jgi:AAA family ATP:ADP antiporter
MATGALLFTHLFLTVASAVIGKAARDAIFLGHFTPLQMTGVDLATMAGVAVVVGLLLRWRARLPVRRVLMLAPLYLAAGDVALWIGLSRLGAARMAWVVYVWVGVQASIVAPHGSILAGQVLNLRQARQMCGRLGAGAIGGWIGGGLIARMLAIRLGAPSLLLASAVLTALCSAIVPVVWRAGADAAGEAPRQGRGGSLSASARLVSRSPHLRSMAALAFISAAVTTIGGFQFKMIASRSIAGADHLAALFGSFSFYAGLAALATPVVITRRVIARFGLGPALAVAPAAIGVGSAAVMWSGTLAAAAFMKGSDQVLRYSVDRAATELLYRPLPARDVFEGKTFIDAIVCRCGDAAGALLALFCVAVLHLGFSSLGVVTLPLLVLWLLFTRVAAGAYRAHLLDSLIHEIPSTPAAQPGGPAFGRHGRKGERALTRGILDADPGTRLRVLRMLTTMRPNRSRARRTNRMLTTALAAESVGLAMLVGEVSSPDASWDEHREEGIDAIERISRLLFLLSPERYPGCLAQAIRSGDLSAEARAQAYLDTTLAFPHRQFLMSLLDRWALAAAAHGSASAPPAMFTASLASVKGVWVRVTHRLSKGAAS